MLKVSLNFWGHKGWFGGVRELGRIGGSSLGTVRKFGIMGVIKLSNRLAHFRKLKLSGKYSGNYLLIGSGSDGGGP